MNILMYGWEFPPYSSGGLGTACYGLTRSLVKRGAHITFVLPYHDGSDVGFLNLVSANITFKQVASPLRPYLTSTQYLLDRRNAKRRSIYGATLFEEVHRYSEAARRIALESSFDVIHCHDWMTFLAGITTKELTGKPLITHVHATEFDRTGGNGVNQNVYDIEKEGMEKADLVIAVSNFTKRKIMEHYGIPESKIRVVHNAVDLKPQRVFHIDKRDKIVLFLGRVTLQKGPDWFLYAAKRVLEKDPDVKFVIAGSGDMDAVIIEKAAELGIAKSVLFTGFLSGENIERAYQMADLYVMPSVSEPFGITALEAVHSGTPVLISKQSGVSEVLTHCLRADFWDVNDVANKILAVLRYGALHHSLKEHGSMEIQKFNWDVPAGKCIDIYNSLVRS